MLMRICVVWISGIVAIIGISCASSRDVGGIIFIAWLAGLGLADYFIGVKNSKKQGVSNEKTHNNTHSTSTKS